MGVYVDSAFILFGSGTRQMKMSHMIADTAAELHEMADKVGLKRSWFQGNASTPHYDVAKSVREKAIKAGTIPLELKDFGKKITEIRERIASGKWDSDSGPIGNWREDTHD